MGIILDIQKFSYHDGPGIRTTVFLKGCNLKCLWCHNPESFKITPQLSFTEENCTLCGICQEVCDQQVHKITPNQSNTIGHKIDFNKCILCKKCIDSCPQMALSYFGKQMTAEEVIDIALKDKAYYDASGGGITFSGGEATLQQEFLFELLTLSKQNDLHTCLETNGCIPLNYLNEILPLIDLFLLDYKLTDPAIRLQYIGKKESKIIDILFVLQENQKPVILRMPIIPSINDNILHFNAAKELKQTFTVIKSIEIMPYHSLGLNKWKQIGLTYPLPYMKEPTKDEIRQWKEFISEEYD